MYGIAEVADEVAMAAADARRVALHLAQQRRRASVSSPFRSSIDAPLHEVGRRRDQHALGLEPVAAGAAGLLLIVLERPRRAGVHDEAHVRPIDPHAERDRRHDHVRVARRETRPGSRCARASDRPGVVRQRAHAGVRQPGGERIDFPARRAVDDARLAAMPRQDVRSCRFRLPRASTR